jgi:hypothetical protein
MPSSVIRSFTYDEASHRLRIVFQSGKVYDYLQVPQTVYEQMKDSFSKGTFFNEQVKPFYKCEKPDDSELGQ